MPEAAKIVGKVACKVVSRDKDGCTPNNVAMCFLGILGDYDP